ncbi:hypothetical protein MRX96_036904 [Rhipicephalus microplus]
MLLPAILLHLEEACALKSAKGTNNQSECDRRRGPCDYPRACACLSRLPRGRPSPAIYYYNATAKECFPGGYRRSCNGFRFIIVCMFKCLNQQG